MHAYESSEQNVFVTKILKEILFFMSLWSPLNEQML